MLLQEGGGSRISTINSITAIAVVAILVLGGHVYAAESLSTWVKSYGGPADENVFRAVARSADGGYVIAGQTNSFGAGSIDVWVIKLGEDGVIEWQKTYGGRNGEAPRAIQVTMDGGYVVAAKTGSFGAGSTDFWVVRFDSAGNVQWQKRYGGSAIDSAESLELTPEGGAIVVGSTRSFGAGIHDILVVRVDSSGSLLGGCGDGFETHDTSASVKTTKAVPVEVEVTEADAAVTIKNTNATVRDSNAIIKTQCSVTPIS